MKTFLCHLCIQPEEVGDDFGFGRVGREAIGGKHGAIVRLVRGAEVGSKVHRVWVVQICKRSVRIFHSRIKDGSRRGGDCLSQRRRVAEIGPREVVVDDGVGITVIAF